MVVLMVLEVECLIKVSDIFDDFEIEVVMIKVINL